MRSKLSHQLFAIDTSILGKAASDYFSPVSAKNKKARKFISTIIDRALVPLFCMHHFQELMQHKNDLKVLNRLKFIKKFPQIAWVKPSSPEGLVGSIIDIHGSEILKLIDNPQKSIFELTSEIRDQIIDYSTGEYLIDNIGEELLTLRDLGIFETQRAKEIASLTHICDPAVNKIKLSELNRSRLNTPPEVNESLEKLKTNLKQGILERGDKKLLNYEEAVSRFVRQVHEESSEMLSSESASLYTKFIN